MNLTNAQKTVETWMQQFGQDAPGELTVPPVEVLKLRASLELEETLEKICKGFGLSIRIEDSYGKVVHISPDEIESKALKIEFFGFQSPNIKEIRDGSADQKVVILGSDVACGIKAEPDFNEVMRSNFSKRWTNEEVAEHTIVPVSCLKVGQTIAIKDAQLIATKVDDSERCWVVKDESRKVIKSPSYSEAKLQ